MGAIESFVARFERTQEEEFSLEEYLELCRRNRAAYATAAERMLAAIGEPVRAELVGVLEEDRHAGL